MLYAVCKAKNKDAQNEEFPKYSSDNWEVKTLVRCRKNASLKTFEKAFLPVFQKITQEEQEEGQKIRLWRFEASEII